MKNYLQLFGSALTMSLFWLVIYTFGNQVLAAYLSGIFGIIAMVILSWLFLKLIIIVKVQSKHEFEHIRKRELSEKVIFKKS